MVIVRLGLDQKEFKITDETYSTFLQKIGRSFSDVAGKDSLILDSPPKVSHREIPESRSSILRVSSIWYLVSSPDGLTRNS